MMTTPENDICSWENKVTFETKAEDVKKFGIVARKSRSCRLLFTEDYPSLYGRPSSALNALKREREPTGSRMTEI